MGLNYGIDFEGGTILEAHIPNTQTEDVRHHLQDNGLDNVSLQELGQPGQYLLRFSMAKELPPEAANEYANEVKEKLTVVWPDAKFPRTEIDRKSTRLNSSHVRISYAVF